MFNFKLEEKILDVVDLFNAAMNRGINNIIPIEGEKILNLGAGEKNFPWSIPLQLPEWDAENQLIPFKENEIDSIVAFHFFEHISPGRIPLLLADCCRVLKKGGCLTIAVPHRIGGMAFQDLDHKSFFTENSWRILMDNLYYKTRNVENSFSVNFNLIMGDSERTLALITQFIKN